MYLCTLKSHIHAMRAKHITSKTTTRWFLLLLTLSLLASSCSKDSDIVTANDYCYIKSVTLGTVKRKTATINTTFSGSSYAMTINLRDNTIENRDSLPFGSQLSRVTANIIFDGLMLTYGLRTTPPIVLTSRLHWSSS